VEAWQCGFVCWLDCCTHTHLHTHSGNILLLPQHQLAAYVAYEWHFDHFIWLLINATLINFSGPQRAPSPSGNVKLFVTYVCGLGFGNSYYQLHNPTAFTPFYFFIFAPLCRVVWAWNNKLLASRRLCLLSPKCTISWCFCGANALMPRPHPPPHTHTHTHVQIPAKAVISDQL